MLPTTPVCPSCRITARRWGRTRSCSRHIKRWPRNPMRSMQRNAGAGQRPACFHLSGVDLPATKAALKGDQPGTVVTDQQVFRERARCDRRLVQAHRRCRGIVWSAPVGDRSGTPERRAAWRNGWLLTLDYPSFYRYLCRRCGIAARGLPGLPDAGQRTGPGRRKIRQQRQHGADTALAP